MQAQLHRAAAEVGLTQAEVAAVLGPVHSLPELQEEDLELEQACWFHRSWLARALPGTALPNKDPVQGGTAVANVTDLDWPPPMLGMARSFRMVQAVSPGNCARRAMSRGQHIRVHCGDVL